MMLSIASVSRDTGIAKEVLRKWEARYGFPVPLRDDTGNRVYSNDQANRLTLIKWLMDAGMRPGQVVALDDARLNAMIVEKQRATSGSVVPGPPTELIAWLQTRDPALLHERLRTELERLGLVAFVVLLMPSMNHLVGEAWASGQIAIRDEHLYTEIVQGLVREARSRLTNPAGSPRILLATPEGELHTLGILMVETVLTIEGARCVSLGAQLPLPEIGMASRDYLADIVGLSFSASFPKRKIIPLLKEMRRQLPDHVRLWAGGGGVAGIDSTPHGITVLSSLPDTIEALQKYRQRLLQQERNGKLTINSLGPRC